MKTLRNKISSSARKKIKPASDKFPIFKRFSQSIYKKYYSSTGSYHSLPDFYILGGQKCGTTSLYLYLVEHPNIKRPTKKDIRFFDKYFSKGIDWYKVHFPFRINDERTQSNQSITCDATERYLEYPHAPTRIKKYTPNAKFIILLREPISRAFSHYNMIVDHGDEKLSFEDAIDEERNRIGNEIQKMNHDENYYSDDYFRFSYLDRGEYIDKIKHWMSVFPKEQFLIIQTEEFQKDTSKVYNEVLEFLGLPKWELKEYAQFKKRKYKSPKMNPETRDKLIEYFKPHNRRLYDFLGREFDWDK